MESKRDRTLVSALETRSRDAEMPWKSSTGRRIPGSEPKAKRRLGVKMESWLGVRETGGAPKFERLPRSEERERAGDVEAEADVLAAGSLTKPLPS